MGDMIVCWRTWELWERAWLVLILPVLCIAGGFGSYLVKRPSIAQWGLTVSCLTSLRNRSHSSVVRFTFWDRHHAEPYRAHLVRVLQCVYRLEQPLLRGHDLVEDMVSGHVLRHIY